MISYSDLQKRVFSELFPFPGEAKSQVASHRRFFREAMINLVKVIPCLQQNHTDVYPACSTFLDCGKTVFDGPRNGIINRVYTIVNGDFCTRLLYDPSNYSRVDSWSRNLLSQFRSPLNTGLPVLQQGIKFPEASTDSPLGRSRVGLWCQHRKRLYLVPWIQSNESVVLEWDGVKMDWQDTDLLDENDWTDDVVAAIKLFVMWCHQRDFGQFDTAPGEEREDKLDYENARADLIWWCRERTRERENEEYPENRLPTSQELKAEVPVAVVEQATIFAIIGNYATGDSAETAVANLVKSWNPSFIVSTGGNWYGADPASTDLGSLDLGVGPYFQSFLFPYLGSYGSGATAQAFFPAISSHDRDPSGRLNVFGQYFNISKAYYQVVSGPLHLFFYDSGYDLSGVNQDKDGVAAGSVQANWLQAALTLSTAQFRVVVINHPPFSSGVQTVNAAPLATDGTLSYPDLQLPFKTWGADLVIAGHGSFYERLLGADGLPYLVNGAGGKDGTDPAEPNLFHDPPLATSAVRFNSDHGAIKASLLCKTLTLEFWSAGGVLVDSMTITRP